MLMMLSFRVLLLILWLLLALTVLTELVELTEVRLFVLNSNLSVSSRMDLEPGEAAEFSEAWLAFLVGGCLVAMDEVTELRELSDVVLFFRCCCC